MQKKLFTGCIVVLIILSNIGYAGITLPITSGKLNNNSRNSICIFQAVSPGEMAGEDKDGGFFTKLFLEAFTKKENMNSKGELNSSSIVSYFYSQSSERRTEQRPIAFCMDEITFYRVQGNKLSWELGKTMLLGIGIDKYQHLTNLLSCVSDITKIEKELRDLAGENLISILLKNQDATRENILKNLYKAIKSDVETIIFYYGGHSTDEILTPVETITSEPYLHGISVEILKKILHERRNKRVIVISDSQLIWGGNSGDMVIPGT
jgi:hypothetical protein